MEIPEVEMVSEEPSKKQPEVSLLTCSVIKRKRTQDFPREKLSLLREAQHLTLKQMRENYSEYKIQGCSTARGIWLRTVSQQQLLQGHHCRFGCRDVSRQSAHMNGIMASTWLRDIPAGSDHDILMAELKNSPFCLKGAYLANSLGIGYT